jgi:hypothetical protein
MVRGISVEQIYGILEELPFSGPRYL